MDDKCVKDLLADVAKMLYRSPYEDNVDILYKHVSENGSDSTHTSVVAQKKVVVDFLNERMNEIYCELMESCLMDMSS